MKRTIASRVLSTVIMFMFPFVFAWALIVGSGFVLSSQQVFNSQVFWIPSVFYWMIWGIWQLISAIDRESKREKMEKLAEEATRQLVSHLSSQQKTSPSTSFKEFEELLRAKKN